MKNPALYTSLSGDWETPDNFFQIYNKKYHFTLDVCASPENTKCEKYYTKEIDGLSQDWGKNICWMNPPYGREIKNWIEKAYKASLNGAVVVCLLPARTDTKWFHEYCIFGDVEFIKGRLKFGRNTAPAPFPSMVVVFPGTENCL